MISINKGSTDVYQKQLEIEPPLEVIYDKQNNVIKTSSGRLKPLFDKTDSKYIYWTRDMTDTMDTNYTSRPTECNVKVFKDKSYAEYLENMYLIRCALNKRIYYIEIDRNNPIKKILLENMTCDITTPDFHEMHPYEFIYNIHFYGKLFNYFNTYFSSFIYIHIRDYIIKWFNSIPVDPKFNTFIKYGDDISQIYNIKNNLQTTNSSDIKIQLNIKEEYFFWAIESIKRNFKILCDLGVNRYKFMSSLVMLKIFKNEEYYPNYFDSKTKIPIDEYFYQYTFLDNSYKRELLNAPNIVFYMDDIVEKEGKLGMVLNQLCNMFPDNLNISNGIPRFNIRINNNIFFSLDGDNEFKFDRELLLDKIMPYEYQTIINISKLHMLTEQQCNKLNEYGEYLSGHTLLKFEEGRCIPNNILTFLIILPTNYKSFYELFNDTNLFDYDALQILGNNINFLSIEQFLINNYNMFGDEILKDFVNFRSAGMNYKIKNKKKLSKKKITRLYKSKYRFSSK